MELKQKFEQFIEEATNEEKEVLAGILQSLTSKRQTEYSTYISSMMKMEITARGENSLEITVPITPILSNSLGIVHGGLTATLMDTAMGSAANMSLPEGAAAVTAEMKVNYTSPGTGGSLRCEAIVLHRGKKVIVTESKVFGDENQLIAVSTGTFFVIKK